MFDPYKVAIGNGIGIGYDVPVTAYKKPCPYLEGCVCFLFRFIKLL